jgi:ABC-type phosphate transport system substrate-binding protein
MLLAITASGPVAAADTVQVVANTTVGITEIPAATLRAIFSMRIRNWPNGEPVQVFVLPDRDGLHITFSREVLRIYPYVLRDTWDRMVFTGTGKAPIEVSSGEKLMQLVADTPGAIGYVNKGSVSHETIRILEIR